MLRFVKGFARYVGNILMGFVADCEELIDAVYCNVIAFTSAFFLTLGIGWALMMLCAAVKAILVVDFVLSVLVVFIIPMMTVYLISEAIGV